VARLGSLILCAEREDGDAHPVNAQHQFVLGLSGSYHGTDEQNASAWPTTPSSNEGVVIRIRKRIQYVIYNRDRFMCRNRFTAASALRFRHRRRA
jgi:hypothetical protein